MSSSEEDDISEIPIVLEKNLSCESILKPVTNVNSVSLKNNSNSTTSSSSSITATKRYASKFKKEWLSNHTYSSFLKEYKNDQTKVLCVVCNVQFSIQNSGVTDVNNSSFFYFYCLSQKLTIITLLEKGNKSFSEQKCHETLVSVVKKKLLVNFWFFCGDILVLKKWIS
jgi:hypothetical protein